MRRILLLLAVAAMMVMMAVPSAGAQSQQPLYCLSDELDLNMEPTTFDPITGESTPAKDTCFNTLEQCLDSIKLDTQSCSGTPQSDFFSAFGAMKAAKEK